MSIQSIDLQSLASLTQKLGFESITWEKRPTQMVTLNYKGSQEEKAERIAKAIAKALNLTSNVIDVVKSSAGGSRTIIWDIPSFATALKKIEELKRAEKFLNDFCDQSGWNSISFDNVLGEILNRRIPFLAPCNEVTIEYQEKEGNYLIKLLSHYGLGEKKNIASSDDIKFILETFENRETVIRNFFSNS
ncbi:MAG TPA: hypothetical protein VLG49_03780 [Rhabdochlamydiaceae bacterium]|nr:hypothetical protein [Rhabdochlamydiaceae bacterium]